ncbi:MAG: HEAT repeat domain-containing protein [Planctomycetaceae bacterium]|nr:HEAT repeat domain-containing protein [Planctomycetaceae bacterium]
MFRKRTTAGALATLAALSLCLAPVRAAEAQPLTNLDVIGFVQANISPNLVVDKIRNSPANFDLSESGLAELRAAGVSDEILAAMRLVGVGYGSTSSLSPLPGIGLPPRSAPPTTASLTPPSLGEIPPSPFGATPAASPFSALEPLPAIATPGTPAASPAASASSVPSLPSLPTIAATPTAPAAGFSSPTTPSAPALSATPPAAQPAFSSPAAPSFSSPAAAPGLASGPGVVPPVSAIEPLTPLPPQAPPAPAVPAVPAAASAPALDANRFNAELTTIITGSTDARRTSMAWLIANQTLTLQPLREALRDSRPEIQAAAVYALGTMRDAQSLAEVRRLIVSPSPLVRANAAEVLAVMDDVESIAAAERALSVIAEPLDGYIRLVGHARLVRTAGNLASILTNNQNAANRTAAAWSLAEMGRAGSVAWPALESALLEDDDSSVRREAVRAVAAYHDPDSARLLETACRRDPDVRKAALQAMADYPSTIEFLVGVMNLGNEQIAADELEAARLSLAKLTGEDFGMDGNGWSRWYGENKSRLAAQPPPVSGLTVAPPPPSSGLAASPETAAVPGRQVDVRAWGIVTDPNEIPMAPEVDATPNLRRAGIAGGPGAPLPPPPSSEMVEGPMGQRGAAGLADSGSMFGGGWGRAETPASPASAGSIADPLTQQPSAATAAGDGVRLPLPPGLIGAGADEQTPLYGSAAARPGAVVAPSPVSGFNGGGEPYAGSYGVYGATPSPIGSYSSDIIVPTADGAVGTPIYGPSPTVDVLTGTGTYTTPTTLSDEVHSQPYQPTGDLVPEAAQAVPMYTGQPETSPLDSLPESYITEVPSEPEAAPSAGLSGLPIPPPPGSAPADDSAATDTGDYGTLAFPGDTDTFGLGDQYFDSEGESDAPPSLFGGMVMPPPPGGASGDYAESDDALGVYAGEAEDLSDMAGPDASFGESFEYDFDHPDSPYNAVDQYAGGSESLDDDEWGEVEDLSSYPAFDDVVQTRAEEDGETTTSAPAAGEDDDDGESAMTITTERARSAAPAPAAAPATAPASSASTSSAPAAPVATPRPAATAPAARAAVEIPPDASEKASKILSALAEIEMGGSSKPAAPAASVEAAEPASPSAPAVAIPPYAVPQPGMEEVTEDIYITEDEVYDVDEYPGGFIPAAPAEDGSSDGSPVGTAQEMPLLGDNLSPLTIPSDAGSVGTEE